LKFFKIQIIYLFLFFHNLVHISAGLSCYSSETSTEKCTSDQKVCVVLQLVSGTSRSVIAGCSTTCKAFFEEYETSLTPASSSGVTADNAKNQIANRGQCCYKNKCNVVTAGSPKLEVAPFLMISTIATILFKKFF
jgi:hypothetical protein